MKNFNVQKFIKTVFASFLIIAVISSCKQEFVPDPEPYDPPSPPPPSALIPVINEISPMKALPGSVITIKGYNFSTVLSNNTATFNGVPIPVNSASIAEVLVTIPANTAPGTSGKIVLTSAGTTLTSVNNFLVTGGTVTAFGAFSNPVSRILVNNLGDTYGITPNSILKITLNGASTVFVAPGTFTGLKDIAKYIDESGDMFVADSMKRRIYKVTPAGNVSAFAGSGTLGYGDGTGINAQFAAPAALAFDANGNLFVADEFRVRKITSSGVVTTLAGSASYADVNGTGDAARFGELVALTIDAAGNIYVADNRYKKIRKITPAGVVTTLAGSGNVGFADGAGTTASFNSFGDIVVDAGGNIFVADLDPITLVYKIRMVTKLGNVSTLITGTSNTTVINGPLQTATVSIPKGLTLDLNGSLYISNSGSKTVNKVAFQ